MSEMKVALKGLTCANCAGKIEDTLSKLSETQEVSINLLRQEMTVKLAPNASAEKMQETVERVVHKFEPEVEVAFLQGQKAEHHHAARVAAAHAVAAEGHAAGKARGA